MTSYSQPITKTTHGILLTVEEFSRKLYEEGWGHPSKKQHYNSDLMIYSQQVSQIPSDATHILWMPSK